eukprot:1979965-Amphidinium_carterae.1
MAAAVGGSVGSASSSCAPPPVWRQDGEFGYHGTIVGKSLKKSLEGIPDEVASTVWTAFDAAMAEELEKVPEVWKLRVTSKLASFNIINDSLSAIVEEVRDVHLGGACIYMDKSGASASIRIAASGRQGTLESGA